MKPGSTNPVFFRFDSVFKHTPDRDFHIHTNITDGSSSLEEYIGRALKLHITEIAFTEHVRKSSHWYHSFVERVEQLQESNKNKIRIYHGIEAKILNLDGDLDATDDMLDTAELILGAVHRLPDSCLQGSGKMNGLPPAEFADIEFRLSQAIIKESPATVLAHPGGMYIRKFNKPFPGKYLENLLDLACKYDTAIEINSSYSKEVLLDMDLFARLNPLISLGSDAHAKEDLGTILQFMKSMKQRLGSSYD